MPTATYEKIATYTIPSNQASYTFTSISTAYTDLILVCNIKTDAASTIKIAVGNGSIDSGANYSYTYLLGNGSAASSSRYAGDTAIYSGYASTSNLQENLIVQFNNYSNTTTKKTTLHRYNDSSTAATAVVGLWNSTSAINTIQLIALGNNLATGTTMTLYGIKAA
jgi:hypothetical protein